jgi:hypothetical protein
MVPTYRLVASPDLTHTPSCNANAVERVVEFVQFAPTSNVGVLPDKYTNTSRGVPAVNVFAATDADNSGNKNGRHDDPAYKSILLF